MCDVRKYFAALICLLFAFMLASCTLSDGPGSAEGPPGGQADQRDSTDASSGVAQQHAPAGASVKQQEIARMQQAIQQYKQFAEQGGWPDLQTGETVKPGDAYGDLADLRRRLALTGDLAQGEANAQDSAYSGALVEAVKHFQARTGLSVDGVLGPNTWSELETSPEERVAALQASLSRMQNLPDTLGNGRFILVNIPEFRLRAYEGDHQVLQMPVIVGEEYDEKQTPRFSDEMEYVIFRPYWNVPDGIAAEEIVPKAREDHSYLEENEYQITSNWGPDAKVFPVTAENLDKVEAGTYKIRQKPGPQNALGLVKFIFPNHHAIYLHGTPADQLFERASRGYSHGCIRVKDPEALAEYVLQKQPEWTPAKIKNAMYRGDWQRVNLEKPIPVHIVYLTAFVDEGGTVHFADDIYGLMNGAPEQALSGK